jgi:hypothetical protein
VWKLVCSLSSLQTVCVGRRGRRAGASAVVGVAASAPIRAHCSPPDAPPPPYPTSPTVATTGVGNRTTPTHAAPPGTSTASWLYLLCYHCFSFDPPGMLCCARPRRRRRRVRMTTRRQVGWPISFRDTGLQQPDPRCHRGVAGSFPRMQLSMRGPERGNKLVLRIREGLLPEIV